LNPLEWVTATILKASAGESFARREGGIPPGGGHDDVRETFRQRGIDSVEASLGVLRPALGEVDGLSFPELGRHG